jgi:hypothetical protein
MAFAGHSKGAAQRYIDLRPAMLKAAVELVSLDFFNNLLFNFVNGQPFYNFKSLICRNEC